MRPARLLARLREGHFENVDFEDFVRLLEACGFQHLRTSGSHLVFGFPGIPGQCAAVVRDYDLRLSAGDYE